MEEAREEFLKSAGNVAAPFFGMAVGAETKHTEDSRGRANFLEQHIGRKDIEIDRHAR